MNARALKILAATKLLPLLLLLVLPAVAQAQYTDSDGNVWEYSGDYVGSDGIDIEGFTLGSSDVVTIPSTIDGLPVTFIDQEVFQYSSVTSVTIPDSVIGIGDYAFAHCTALTSVTIPDSVTYIYYDAFYDCTSLTNAIIGNGVIDFGEDAFADCTKLTSVTIGTNVTSIDEDAFASCIALTSVTIPDSVTSIGDYAFDYCTHLTNAIIGANVTSIGEVAFESCSLTNVIIPANVTSIGEFAFAACNKLTAATIGSGVTSIGSDTFAQCPSLTAVYFQGNSPTPTNDLTVFDDDNTGIVYYELNTSGWGSMFDGWPTMTNGVSSIVGTVTQIVGNPNVTRNGITSPLLVGSSLMQGDVITTDKSSAVNIQFADNTAFVVTESARITVDQYLYDSSKNTGSAIWNAIQGLFVYTSGLIGKNPDSENPNVVVETPVAGIGIRGTQFITGYDPCSSTQTVYLIEGELTITPLNTPGVTNICDAPVTIYITPDSVTTNMLTQAMYDSVSNQLLQAIGTFPAWQEQYFGCTNDPDAAPTADPSGDGEDNYSKFLAGMNPTNAASYFHILSATNNGDDMLVSWMCGGGTTNVLQATTNLVGTWSNISPNIVLAGGGDSITNYLDVGGFTNSPARFYRVLLVQ
jgi:BspA type Leucine rich repeat region (6 copies)/FecR protein